MTHTMKLLLATYVLAGSGCSFLFVQRAPEHARAGAVNCTTSRAAPVVDTLYATLNAAIAAAAAASSSGPSCRPGEFCIEIVHTDRIAVSSAILAVVTGASALYGWSSTSRCIELLEAPREPVSLYDSEAVRRMLPPANPPEPAHEGPLDGRRVEE